MLIGYSQPKATGYQIAGTSAGAAWINNTQDGLTDGKPGRKALFNFHGGPANTGEHVRFVVDHAGTIHKPKIAALLGLNLPVGTRVFADPVLAGNVLVQARGDTRTVKLADGSIAAWFVLPQELDADRFDFVIFNDVNNTSPFTGSTVIEIGEAVFMPAVDLNHQSDWSESDIDPSLVSRTLGGQINSVRRSAYRRLQLNLTPDDVTRVRGAGLANAMNWRKLRTALQSSKRCAVVPRWKTPAGAVDVDALHSTALYGVCLPGSQIQHLGGDYYTSSLVFDEIPPA
jgi:hypothetical protein